MKKFILSITVFCFFAFGFGGGCFYEDSLDTAEELMSILFGMHYGNSDAVNLYYISAGAGGKIYRSPNPLTNTWTARNSGTTNNINCMKGTDRVDTGIVFGAGDNGTVVRSLDEGMTWTVLNTGVTANLNGIDFLGSDINKIIAVGDGGLIIKSTNGGNNWSILNSGVTKNLNTIYSANSFLTVAAGEKGTYIRTTNNGNTWENRSLPDSVTDLNKIGLMGTWFFGNFYGLIGDNGKLYKSNDLMNWDSINTGTNKNLREIKFKNANSGYVCGDSGAVRYTTNAGLNWYSDGFFLNTTQNINSTVMLNDTTVACNIGTDIIIAHMNETLLPVELSSFNFSVINNSVHLSWLTENEFNNSGFNIERSLKNNADPVKREWINAAFVMGHGTSNERIDYSYTDESLNPGTYFYRLKQIDYNGNFEYFNLENEVNIGAPERFTLSQNYPNPFNPVTKISFNVPVESKIYLSVFDITGKEVAILVNERLHAGYFEYEWDASSFSSGTYFYRLRAEGVSEFSEVKKMLLIK